MAKKTAAASLLIVLFLTACGDRQPLDTGTNTADPTSTDGSGSAVSSSDKSVLSGIDKSLDLCDGLITHKDRLEIKRVAKPPFLKRYKDPVFGTTIMRISDSSDGTVHKPLYSTVQAWNADERYMILYRTGMAGVAHLLLDGHTYKPIRTLALRPADLEELFWSHQDPDSLFYVSAAGELKGHLVRYSVSADQSESLKDFTPLCGTSAVLSGSDVQMQSADDDLFGFRCETKTEGKARPIMFTYRISTDEISVADLDDPWTNTTAPMPGPSGDRLYQQGRVLDTDLLGVTAQLDQGNYAEHGSIGLTIDGKDALFQTTFDPAPAGCNRDTWKGVGHLIEYNLETGNCRPVINESKGWPYTTSGTHVSARAHLRPGWVAMSSIGYDHLDYHAGGSRPPALVSEIYLVRAGYDRSRVCRLAHHRSVGKSARNGGYTSYFGEPHATISPSGTRILFGSDWYDSGAVDAYVIELPEYRRSR